MKPSVLVKALIAAALLSCTLTAHAQCLNGPAQCRQGYVWREAFPGDTVCVTGEVRAQAAADNSQGNARRSPEGGPFPPDTCIQGYVWREARAEDRVCVTGAVRAQAAADNSQANARTDPACAVGPVTNVSSISVLAINAVGTATHEGVPWRTRYERIASWAAQNIAPDVITLTEFRGWLVQLIGTCDGYPPGVSLGDYDAIDFLLERLRAATGITYRVAYLSGGEASGYAGRCLFYAAHAMLYNPDRLINRTAQADTSTAVGHNDQILRLHLRRSLPLCNRQSNLMPLDTLIDGAPQRDKCNRETPSGPVWITRRSGYSWPIATSIRFSPVQDPSWTVDILNIHPDATEGLADVPAIQQIIDAVTGTADRALFPPIVAGDFNALSGTRALSRLQDAFVAPPQELWNDQMDIEVGRADSFTSRCVPRVAQQLTIPLRPTVERPCGPGPVDQLISDHCGVFVRFERDGSEACRLRDLRVVAPQTVRARATYQVRAVPFGGGPDWAFRWEPGGSTVPILQATAGGLGTSQTWTATVTDPASGMTLSRSVTVGTSSQLETQCIEGCDANRDRCIASCNSGPCRGRCVQVHEACTNACE